MKKRPVGSSLFILSSTNILCEQEFVPLSLASTVRGTQCPSIALVKYIFEGI